MMTVVSHLITLSSKARAREWQARSAARGRDDRGMKAPDFDYHRPGSLQDALALLSEHGAEAQPLAGGQSLLPMMNFRIASPAILVDLSRVPELRGIERGRTRSASAR